MTCKKTLQLKFGETIEFDAMYDFDWIKIKVDMTLLVEDPDVLTAKQLRRAPIKTAIAELQKLLLEEEPPQEQGHKLPPPGASDAPDAA